LARPDKCLAIPRAHRSLFVFEPVMGLRLGDASQIELLTSSRTMSVHGVASQEGHHVQTTITTFDNSAEGWERALYAFLAEKERRSGSRQLRSSPRRHPGAVTARSS
jgi:hypothetical protein